MINIKTISCLAFLTILAVVSCGTQTNPTTAKVDFGIYEYELSGKPGSFNLSTTTKVIGLDDIRDTKADGREVVIYFNMDGAKKWAEMTKNNIGKPIAFAVDNKIIYTPTIASELRNGVAKIPGLDDDANAISLSESINASIPK